MAAYHCSTTGPSGLKTLHGFTTRGFPNWFYIGVSQNAFDVNMTSMFDEQARHIAYIIDETLTRGATTVEPTEQGVQEWLDCSAASTSAAVAFLAECTPGYYNNEGQPKGGSGFAGAYPAGPAKFNKLLEEWRSTGELPGMELDGAPAGGRPPTIRTALHRDRRQRPSRAHLNRAPQASETVMDGGVLRHRPPPVQSTSGATCTPRSDTRRFGATRCQC